jgi:hypothetical protein
MPRIVRIVDRDGGKIPWDKPPTEPDFKTADAEKAGMRFVNRHPRGFPNRIANHVVFAPARMSAAAVACEGRCI